MFICLFFNEQIISLSLSLLLCAFKSLPSLSSLSLLLFAFSGGGGYLDLFSDGDVPFCPKNWYP